MADIWKIHRVLNFNCMSKCVIGQNAPNVVNGHGLVVVDILNELWLVYIWRRYASVKNDELTPYNV